MKRAPLWPWFCIGVLVTGVALILGASGWQAFRFGLAGALLVDATVAVVLKLSRWPDTG